MILFVTVTTKGLVNHLVVTLTYGCLKAALNRE